jgi:IS30 family transposase
MGTNYKHLSCEERTMIQLSLEQGCTLWAHVVRLLRERHSPEQIAGILRRMQPDEPMLQVSHETIYTALYAMPRGELRTELITCLRQARKSRRPRARGEDRRGTIPNMVSIHVRPPGNRGARHPRTLGG